MNMQILLGIQSVAENAKNLEEVTCQYLFMHSASHVKKTETFKNVLLYCANATRLTMSQVKELNCCWNMV